MVAPVSFFSELSKLLACFSETKTCDLASLFFLIAVNLAADEQNQDQQVGILVWLSAKLVWQFFFVYE